MKEDSGKDKIELDLDGERLRAIIGEAYNICKDYLQTDFDISREQLIAKINPYLECNRISIPIRLELPCKSFPGMIIEVKLRSKKVMVRMFPKRHQVTLNHMLGGL
jgi:hypothetical protein